MNPNNQVYYSAGGNPNGRKRLLLIIGLVAVIIIAVAYLIFGGGNGNQNDNNETTNNDSASKVAVETLSSPKLLAPSNTKGYVKRTNFTIDIGDYTTNNNACNFQFGVAPAIELPGITPQSIAVAHIGASETAGATGITIEDGKDLVRKGANSSTEYVIPTQDIEFVRDNVYYRATYAIALLKDNSRVYARWYCVNSEGPVADNDFKKISDKVKEIKVQP
jgi:hypothetical protein